MERRDESGPVAFLRDVSAETLRSLRATPIAARIAIVAGLAGFVVSEFVPTTIHNPWYLAVARIIFLFSFTAGTVVHARYADEFYRQIYLASCAIALPAYVLFVYAATLFDMHVGPKTLGYAVAIWFVSFIISFAAYRQ